jgi:SAM-dependent methyltransferase
VGIDVNTAQFLFSEQRRGVTFGRTLTLGHQQAYIERPLYQELVAGAGGRVVDAHYADDLFRALGANTLDIMDASEYENANVIHDLNAPVDNSLKEKYDCVFDGGTLEHVFNYPVALRSCMEMVKVGGHLVLVTPMNNFAGHGFFQFSPELFYSALSPENGFLVERMMFPMSEQWYSVQNPAIARKRIELIGNDPLLLYISAKRVSDAQVFKRWPQQSDYAAVWASADGSRCRDSSVVPWKELVVRVIPGLAYVQSRWRGHKYRRRLSVLNREWYSPVTLDGD